MINITDLSTVQVNSAPTYPCIKRLKSHPTTIVLFTGEHQGIYLSINPDSIHKLKAGNLVLPTIISAHGNAWEPVSEVTVTITSV
jgi:hypothetical protein